jgi:hypothetical protein
MALAADASLESTDREYLETHTHAHLDVFVDGVHVPVPSGIGIDVDAPEGISVEPTDDGVGTQYFVSRCVEPCLSPLHAHEPGGVVHTESIEPDLDPLTLGQFFTEWGVPMSESCIGDYCTSNTGLAVYVNGEEHVGNPADVLLVAHAEIAVIIGIAPAAIPSEWTFLEHE